MNTHLLAWLPHGYDHCRYGSREWCESYLNNAVETIRELSEALAATVEYIDAIPDDTAQKFPAMPGFDRDHVDSLLKPTRRAQAVKP